MKIKANGIQIEVEDTGADGSQNDRPVVLLIMGLGMQLIAWPPALVQGLVDAGFRVIRHDNRDIGLSQHFDHLGVPNLVWATLQHRLGLSPKAPFTLSDMAADAVGVLDALKIERAHIVGVSMGGMIAQRVAIAAPKRVLSLTSIMSSSGARGLPRAKPQVLKALLSKPASHAHDDIVDHYINLYTVIGELIDQRSGSSVPDSARSRAFFGADLWTAFELSWLNLRGKPQVALAHITVPAKRPTSSRASRSSSTSTASTTPALPMRLRCRQRIRPTSAKPSGAVPPCRHAWA
jgi:pimeloyl-ACP methyl ester carboxylesterase